MSNFRVGQKVVCIDSEGFERQLTQGRIYTVRSVDTAEGFYRGWTGIFPIVALHETKDPYEQNPYYTGKIGFAAARFRPVVKRPTSIAIFTKLLRKSEQRNRRELEVLEREHAEVPFQ